MKTVLSFDEIRKTESDIILNHSIPSLMLMENAGRNSFEVIEHILKDICDHNIFIVCGKGNNAGDGYTIARHMSIDNVHVSVINLSEDTELKGDALINYNVLKELNSDYVEFLNDWKVAYNTISKSKKVLIIDAILGTGIKGEINDKLKNVIEDINKLRLSKKDMIVISVDVPSGLSSDCRNPTVINADITLTMGVYKEELLFNKGYENSGIILPVHIGINDSYFNSFIKPKKFIIDETDVKAVFPRRKKISYKYSNGKVLVIGGSKGLSGAIAMSCLSALKSGAGSVTAAYPEGIDAAITRSHHDIMKLSLSESANGTITGKSYDELKKRIEWADCVLAGPGLSTDEDTEELMYELITNCSKNIIIDADGLNSITKDISVLHKRKNPIEIILTPHIGEFARLTGKDPANIIRHRFEAAEQFSNEYNVSVVFKSERTFSCLKQDNLYKHYINPTGNEALATAGTGDILSGIIASLMAQTNDIYTACVAGNYLHGKCADLYFEKTGNKQSATSKDILNQIPKAITDILN